MENEKTATKNFNIKIFDENVCEKIDTVFAKTKKIYGNKNDFLVACLLSGANEIGKSIHTNIQYRDLIADTCKHTKSIIEQLVNGLFEGLDDEEYTKD